VHGNISVASATLPSNTLGVGPGDEGAAFAFAAVAPNPAVHEARFHFTLPARANVSLAIYDPLGRRVRTLADGPLAAGANERVWDVRDEGGTRARPGVYFARLVTGAGALTRRVTVIGD